MRTKLVCAKWSSSNIIYVESETWSIAHIIWCPKTIAAMCLITISSCDWAHSCIFFSDFAYLDVMEQVSDAPYYMLYELQLRSSSYVSHHRKYCDGTHGCNFFLDLSHFDVIDEASGSAYRIFDEPYRAHINLPCIMICLMVYYT